MRAIVVTFPTLTNTATAICASQAVASSLLINGTLASSGVATLAAAQPVSFASSSNLSGINFTITGTDADERSQSEVVAGPNNNAVITLGYYKTITSITASSTSASLITVGAIDDNGAVSKTQVLNWRAINSNVTFAMTFGTEVASASVDVSYTDPQSSEALSWFNTPLNNVNANISYNIKDSVSAARFRLNSYTSGTGLELTILSGGYALGG
jgi:hypothetical protein